LHPWLRRRHPRSAGGAAAGSWPQWPARSAPGWPRCTGGPARPAPVQLGCPCRR
jgi:hypothetical protein